MFPKYDVQQKPFPHEILNNGNVVFVSRDQGDLIFATTNNAALGVLGHLVGDRNIDFLLLARGITVKRCDFESVTLVGIYAENAVGEITHRDSNAHVHVLGHGDKKVVAHVDKVSLRPGASVKFPAAR